MDELLEGLGFPVVSLPPGERVSQVEAILCLTDFLATTAQLPWSEAPAVIAGVLERETRGSTGMGKGLALPHLACNIERATGVVGHAPSGIAWDGSYDNGPVRHIVLLLTPASKPRETLLAQERVLRHLFKSEHARAQALRLKAYRLWEAAGRPSGADQHFWYGAERELHAGRLVRA